MRRSATIYVVAWIAFMAMYTAGMVASGASIGLGVRNAVANLLPDALLGILVLRMRAPLERNFVATQIARMFAFILIVSAAWLSLVAVDSLIFTGRVALRVIYRVVPFKVMYD